MTIMLDIKPKQGNNICTISAIGNIISFYGIERKEYEVYIISDGFNTSYCDGYVAINSLKEISDSFYKHGLFHAEWSKPNVNEASKVIFAIEKGMPVIVLINSDFLRFDPRLTKKYGFLRSFIIYGVNTETGMFSLYDTFYIDEEQTIDVIDFEVPIVELLRNAREYLIIEPPKQKEIHCDLRALLIKNLKEYLNEPKGEPGEGVYRRQNAVHFHIERIEEILFRGDAEDKSKACYYISNTIRYGTFIPMTSYLIDYFSERETPCEVELLDELKALKTVWNIISNKAIKLTLSKKPQAQLDFIEKYRQAFERTTKFLRKMISILESENSKERIQYED